MEKILSTYTYSEKNLFQFLTLFYLWVLRQKYVTIWHQPSWETKGNATWDVSSHTHDSLKWVFPILNHARVRTSSSTFSTRKLKLTRCVIQRNKLSKRKLQKKKFIRVEFKAKQSTLVSFLFEVRKNPNFIIKVLRSD